MRKIITLLLIVFVISLVGCQNTAQKKIVNPNKNIENQANLSESEHRVMASKISNLAQKVAGVNRASVVIARTNLNEIGFAKEEKSNKVKSKYNKPSPNSNYPDVNDNNVNTVTDDNNRNMAQPGGGLVVIIGISPDENIKNNSSKLNQVRSKIKEAVRTQEFRTSQVYVTSNPELVGRIDNIAAAILQGEPISNYDKEIKDIIKKIK